MCWRRDFCTSLDGKCVSCCGSWSEKLGNPQPRWPGSETLSLLAQGEAGRGACGNRNAADVSRGPSRRDDKTALDSDRKPLAFSAPTCTLPTGRGRVVRQGTSLETGHPRLRPAGTHYYSEMVTSGASLPFILEWTWACGGRFLFGVATAG